MESVFRLQFGYDGYRMRALARVLFLMFVAACSGQPGVSPDPWPADSGATPRAGDAGPEAGDGGAASASPARVYLAVGSDLPPAIGARLHTLLSSIPGLDPLTVDERTEISALAGLVIALGDHPLALSRVE